MREHRTTRRVIGVVLACALAGAVSGCTRLIPDERRDQAEADLQAIPPDVASALELSRRSYEEVNGAGTYTRSRRSSLPPAEPQLQTTKSLEVAQCLQLAAALQGTTWRLHGTLASSLGEGPMYEASTALCERGLERFELLRPTGAGSAERVPVGIGVGVRGAITVGSSGRDEGREVVEVASFDPSAYEREREALVLPAGGRSALGESGGLGAGETIVHVPTGRRLTLQVSCANPTQYLVTEEPVVPTSSQRDSVDLSARTRVAVNAINEGGPLAAASSPEFPHCPARRTIEADAQWQYELASGVRIDEYVIEIGETPGVALEVRVS